MITRTIATMMSLAALALAGCQPAPASTAPVTTTSPAGQSTAPSAAAAEKRGNALVRVVHAIPAGATVDLFADETRAFESLAFKTVSPYLEMNGQRYTFRLRPAGMHLAEPLATNAERLDEGTHYTVFAIPGDDEAARLRVVADDHVQPAAGKARVRVVHASRDAGEIDLSAAGRTDVLFDGVDFQSVTGYEEIDPIVGTLELRPEGSPNLMLAVPGVDLAAGKSYSIVVVGRVRTAPKLEAFVIEDQTMLASTPR